QRSGEAKAMHEAKAERQQPAPTRVADGEVFDTDVRNRQRNTGFADASWHTDPTQGGGDERDRVRDGEGGDDLERVNHPGFQAATAGEQQKTDQERNVIIAGEDVGDAHLKVFPDAIEHRNGAPHLPAALIAAEDKILEHAVPEVEARKALVARIEIEEEVV